MCKNLHIVVHLFGRVYGQVSGQPTTKEKTEKQTRIINDLKKVLIPAEGCQGVCIFVDSYVKRNVKQHSAVPTIS